MYFFTKYAGLMRRSTVLSLPLQLEFPARSHARMPCIPLKLCKYFEHAKLQLTEEVGEKTIFPFISLNKTKQKETKMLLINFVI
jgi:hypothetical protein